MLAGRNISRPIMGSIESITGITSDDLREHHHRYYSPSNMILTIATSRDTSEVIRWVRSNFDSLSAAANEIEYSSPGDIAPAKELHKEVDKEQIGIYAGALLRDISNDASLDLKVAVSVLSHRLYQTLREKQGLAYSTGASVTFSSELSWYYLTVGTGSENYQKALDGLILQTEKLAFDGPTVAEVNSVKNRLYGRLMSSKLSRVNQAYYLGLNEFLGRPINYDQKLATKLSRVTDFTVRQAASRFFKPSGWVVATAGKKSNH